MMHLIVIATAWAAIGGLPVSQAVPRPETVEITLKRTVCFGYCPAYTVTIRGDGTVTFEGIRFVQAVGVQTAQIDPADVAKLVAEFNEADFFGMKDTYRAPISDLPSTYVTLKIGERVKVVEDYYGAPPDLKALERRIDEVAGTKQWIGPPVRRDEAAAPHEAATAPSPSGFALRSVEDAVGAPTAGSSRPAASSHRPSMARPLLRS